MQHRYSGQEYMLNDKQFNVLKKNRNQLSQACGNKRDSRKAFNSVREAAWLKPLSDCQYFIKMSCQAHSKKAAGSSQATKSTSVEKHCRKSTQS